MIFKFYFVHAFAILSKFFFFFCLTQDHKDFCPAIFFPRNFIFLHLISGMICFYYLLFMLQCIDQSFFLYILTTDHLLKTLSVFYTFVFELLSKTNWPYLCGCTFTLFCFLDLVFHFDADITPWLFHLHESWSQMLFLHLLRWPLFLVWLYSELYYYQPIYCQPCIFLYYPFLYCLIRLIKILLRIFVPMFMMDTGLQFSCHALA